MPIGVCISMWFACDGAILLGHESNKQWPTLFYIVTWSLIFWSQGGVSTLMWGIFLCLGRLKVNISFRGSIAWVWISNRFSLTVAIFVVFVLVVLYFVFLLHDQRPPPTGLFKLGARALLQYPHTAGQGFFPDAAKLFIGAIVSECHWLRLSMQAYTLSTL